MRLTLFDRPHNGTRAVLVHLEPAGAPAQPCGGDDSLDEFRELAATAGVEVLTVERARVRVPNPRFFLGAGKVEALRMAVKTHGAELMLVNQDLTPVQERNLERCVHCRVVDRTGLILDIFAQRARTFEGKLQVELAQLQHLSTRLVRGWTHLERQKGGIGLRGPGETQLETDRRLIGRRIRQLHRRLDKVQRQRHQQRAARLRAEARTISLVGYTNTGKSTLFNRLTGAGTYAADQLFATLDPTLRRLHVSGLKRGLARSLEQVVLADTVGFIRDLPHQLVAAFQATLEEVRLASLLLHVVDACSENRRQQVEQVNRVLAEIGASEVPQIEVYNKIDLLPGGEPRIDRDTEGHPERVWISARDGTGLELLHQAIAERLDAAAVSDGAAAGTDTGGRPCIQVTRCLLRLHPRAGGLRSRLFQWQVVEHETTTDRGEWLLEVAADRALLTYLRNQRGCQVVMAEGEYGGACDAGGAPLKSASC